MGCCAGKDKEILDSLEVVKGRESVFIVPGMCSNAIEVKVAEHKDHEVVYLNIEKIIEEGPSLFHELEFKLVDAKLESGETVKSVTEKTAGISSRAVKGLQGCAHLDPDSEIPLAPLWMPIIKLLCHHVNLRGLAYDWRRWGDRRSAEDVLKDFRKDVEKMVEDGGSPVHILGHSMGAQVVMWCLSQLGEEWEKKNVKQIIFCAPAISGTPVLYPCFANGPAGNMIEGGMVNMPLAVADHDLTRITATFPCMIAEFPVNTGGNQVFPKDQVFASTPSKKYTVDNVASFFEDCVKCAKKGDDHWDIGKGLWPGYEKIAASIRPPVVPMQIIYSKSEDTLSQVRYDTEDISQAPHMDKYEGGDTTITGASIEALAAAWIKSGAKDIELHSTPTDAHVTHHGCIDCDFTFRILAKMFARRNVNEDTNGNNEALQERAESGEVGNNIS